MRTIRSLAVQSAVVAAVVAALISTPALADPPDSPPGLDIANNALPPEDTNDGVDRARQILAGITARLIARDDVVGTGLSLTDAGGPLIKVYLKNAGGAEIPARAGGFPVEVEVVGEIFARSHTIQRYRPAPIGVSTGHPDITAGTIGCRVTDGFDVYALSNNHVYADVNMASIGDNVLQPGVFDGGIDPTDAIGTLSDFEVIVFDPAACNPPDPNDPECNVIDAAIAISSTADLGTRTLCDGYGLPTSTPVAASVRMKVKKYGRTTGQTAGRVDATDATVDVNYGAAGIARFVDQIVIKPGSFSDGGDSGSLIVVRGGPDDRSPVGLLFAGSFFVTIANPIDPVLARFGVTVDDTSEAETSCDDGVDNDCDGLIDCDDSNCDLDAACLLGCALDADCDDGLACNGGETCAASVCQPGTPVNCDDAVACTVDSCIEPIGSCESVPDDSACDDGLFCNGEETCDLGVGDCLVGTAPCALDEVCLEGSDTCCFSTESPEVSCSDGIDNDCDGLIDAADPDCIACGGNKATCGSGGDCCSGNCKGGRCRGN